MSTHLMFICHCIYSTIVFGIHLVVFCEDLNLCDPPSDAVGLFSCYNATLQSLVDKHAPFADVDLELLYNKSNPNSIASICCGFVVDLL